jgi:hypothetical protein
MRVGKRADPKILAEQIIEAGIELELQTNASI